jgi:hypothetical protein
MIVDHHFHVRLSSDGGVSFAGEVNPPGEEYYSDWAPGQCSYSSGRATGPQPAPRRWTPTGAVRSTADVRSLAGIRTTSDGIQFSAQGRAR